MLLMAKSNGLTESLIVLGALGAMLVLTLIALLLAGPLMKQRGGPVWAQDAASCACSSQPDSVRDTGCVSYSGTPEKLALALVEYVRQDIRRGLH